MALWGTSPVRVMRVTSYKRIRIFYSSLSSTCSAAGVLQKLFLIVPHHELQRGIPLCAVLLGRGKIGVPVSCSLRQRAAGAFSVPMINVQIFHSAFQRVQRVQIFCSRKANRRLPERAQPRRFTQQSQR